LYEECEILNGTTSATRKINPAGCSNRKGLDWSQLWFRCWSRELAAYTHIHYYSCDELSIYHQITMEVEAL